LNYSKTDTKPFETRSNTSECIICVAIISISPQHASREAELADELKSVIAEGLNLLNLTFVVHVYDVPMLFNPDKEELANTL